MKITETNIKGCFILEPNVFKDNRGVFFESFKQDFFQRSISEKINFIQDNQSISKKGVLRGLHYQKGKYAQSKLVRVVTGEVIDVVIDLRKDSLTFGEHFKITLSSKNNKMLFIPKGMAHGFLATKEDTIFAYKCDNYYNAASEGGILFNDPDLAIDWGFSEDKFIISQKDLELPNFKNAKF